jgi:dolichyl-phosphate-mannose-protein mannosyltransferase
MTSKPPRIFAALSHENLVVCVITLIGAVVRCWSPGRLGLVHFDEGIYATAGLWSLSPGGLQAFDPTVIAYAPPGFPFLVGLSYLVFGMRDLAAIAVSIAAGTLTIPVAAWLSRRTFGPGAGAVAAAFTALSGPHIAFSRMALTDASFLLCWLVAIGMGQRFVEQPNPLRAVALGLAVGLAQLFKYNGWLTGAIVLASVVVWLLFHPREWRTRSTAATWGWGVVAAAVAALSYWPWFRFVDSHGGYQALLAHQRSYLGGLSSWPAHWSLQLAQERALSGNPIWIIGAGLLAAVAMVISTGDLTAEPRRLVRLVLEIAGLSALCSIRGASWWITLVWTWFALDKSRGLWTLDKSRGLWTKSLAVVAIGWTTLSALTPFYHPYARLWLPVEAFAWLSLGGVFVSIRSNVEVADRGRRWDFSPASDRLPWFTVLCVLLAAVAAFLQSGQNWLPVLAPSDTLRQASHTIQVDLPANTKALSAFARPPLLFYAASDKVALYRFPDLAQMLGPRNPTSWALLDLALTRQHQIPEQDLDRMLAPWTVVREIDTSLNGPTLLDIDPAAAREATIDASARVKLLRRKRVENVQ